MPGARSFRPSLFALVLSVVPGLGHLVLGRSRRGCLLFIAASFFANLAFLSVVTPVPPLDEQTRVLGLVVAAAFVLFSVLDVFRLAILRRLPGAVAARDATFRRALRHYLRREWKGAREAFDELLDDDPSDPVVRLYVAVMERRAGQPARALHHAKKALSNAPDPRFRPEIEAEIGRAKEAVRAS